MSRHYKHQWQRPDIREIAEIREAIAVREALLPYVHPIIKPRWQRVIDEKKLLYRERTGRDYIPLPEHFDMIQTEETR